MDVSTPKRRMRPAKTSEAREQQLIALAIDRVEERMLNGTATSQEYVHFLKLATMQAKLDKEEQEARIALLKAKKKAIESAELQEEYFNEVIRAVRSYQGAPSNDQGIHPNIQ